MVVFFAATEELFAITDIEIAVVSFLEFAVDAVNSG